MSVIQARGITGFSWSVTLKHQLPKVLCGEALPSGTTPSLFLKYTIFERLPFRKPSNDKWYPIHIQMYLYGDAMLVSLCEQPIWWLKTNRYIFH